MTARADCLSRKRESELHLLLSSCGRATRVNFDQNRDFINDQRPIDYSNDECSIVLKAF